MMRGSGRFILLAILAAICVFVVFKYFLISDEEKIKKVLYQGKEAIEKEDLEGVMSHVSRYYRDEYGFNYLGVRSLFHWVFEQFDDIAIHVEGIEVDVVEKKKGVATLRTWATARGPDKAGYMVGASQQPRQVLSPWKRGGETGGS